MESKTGKKICVLGSANADYFLYLRKIPAPGETIQSDKFMKANGGKGANQAVAVGKLSGQCSFLGQVGDDDPMRALTKEMESAKVKLCWKVLPNISTGRAFIYVQDSGENSIVIHGGANMSLWNLEELDPEFKKIIEESDYLLLQKEVPMQIDVLAAKYAHSLGKIVILDCGGRDDPISQELLDNLTYISPNETELLRLDETIKSGSIEEIKEKLLKKHPNLKVLLKLGSKGSSLISSKLERQVHCDVAPKYNKNILDEYKIIDTVGAGDCFTGAFAVKHSELDWTDPATHQENYRKAMLFGNSAAFLCITKKGAMPSLPERKDVDLFMSKYQIK